MKDEKIIQKLQKLLALSASDNENEAAQAMKKAEEIMRQYKISTRDVAEDGSGAYVKSTDVPTSRRIPAWVKTLAVSLAEAFDGKVLTRYESNSRVFTFIAGKTDLAIMVDLFERLQKTVKRMSATYVRKHRHLGNSRSLGNSYRVGLVFTISDRLEKIRENSKSDDTRNAYGITGNELMVVKAKAVEQKMKKMFPHAKIKRTRHVVRSHDAFMQGMTDGNNVSLHRSVDGSSEPIGIGM